jgi:hypothetical protein
MSWDAIGAVGQVVSALGLAFVVIQVRDARIEMRRGVRQDRLQATQEMLLVQATHPQFASALDPLRASTGSPPNLIDASPIAALRYP